MRTGMDLGRLREGDWKFEGCMVRSWLKTQDKNHEKLKTARRIYTEGKTQITWYERNSLFWSTFSFLISQVTGWLHNSFLTTKSHRFLCRNQTSILSCLFHKPLLPASCTVALDHSTRPRHWGCSGHWSGGSMQPFYKTPSNPSFQNAERSQWS